MHRRRKWRALLRSRIAYKCLTDLPAQRQKLKFRIVLFSYIIIPVPKGIFCFVLHFQPVFNKKGRGATCPTNFNFFKGFFFVIFLIPGISAELHQVSMVSRPMKANLRFDVLRMSVVQTQYPFGVCQIALQEVLQLSICNPQSTHLRPLFLSSFT